jgi:hypothetical protein
MIDVLLLEAAILSSSAINTWYSALGVLWAREQGGEREKQQFKTARRPERY